MSNKYINIPNIRLQLKNSQLLQNLNTVFTVINNFIFPQKPNFFSFSLFPQTLNSFKIQRHPQNQANSMQLFYFPPFPPQSPRTSQMWTDCKRQESQTNIYWILYLMTIFSKKHSQVCGTIKLRRREKKKMELKNSKKNNSFPFYGNRNSFKKIQDCGISKERRYRHWRRKMNDVTHHVAATNRVSRLIIIL